MRVLPIRGSLGWSMSLAIVLVAGLMTAVWMAIGATSLLSSMWDASESNNEQLVFTLEGEPLLSTRIAGDPVARFRTLDGQPVEKPEDVKISTANPQALPPAEANPRTFPGWSHRILGFLQPPPPATQYWYLLQGDDPTNLSYFIGYDPKTRRVVGYIGRQGYRATLPPAEERFTIRGSMFAGVYAAAIGTFSQEPYRWEANRPYLFLVADGELFKIDLRDQAVAPVQTSSKVVSIGQYEQPTAVDDEDRDAVYQWRIVVRLPHELQIRSTDGKLLRAIQLPDELEDQTISVRGTTTDEMMLLSRPADEHYAPLDVYRAGSDGTAIQQGKISGGQRPEPPGEIENWAAVAVAPLPLPLALVSFTTIVTRATNNPAGPGVREPLKDLVATFGLPYLALLAVSSVFAVYAYRRQRVYDPTSATAWAVFVFLFGPPGIIGYLLHRRWPPRAACAHCGKWVPCDRMRCTVCREEFSAPALKGIEVFA